MRLDISDLSKDFPDFRVAAIVTTGAVIAPRSDHLAEEIERRENAFRAQWGATPLADIPGIAVWRAAYRAFGIKKTSYRCSVERLAKNAQAGRPLPDINAFVDVYNAVSLTHVLPAGADDLEHVKGDVAFRYARQGDDFRDMAETDRLGNPVSDPPKEGEVVYADGEKVLCRRWNWRQDARSLVVGQTTRAIITVQSNGVGNLEDAVEDLRELLSRFCGGATGVAIADVACPIVDLPDL